MGTPSSAKTTSDVVGAGVGEPRRYEARDPAPPWDLCDFCEAARDVGAGAAGSAGASGAGGAGSAAGAGASGAGEPAAGGSVRNKNIFILMVE